MSAKAKPLDRPFAPGIWRRATRIARRYQVVMWSEGGEYYGRGLELPGVMADGETPDACMEQTREALAAAVATLLEDDEVPPPPAMTRRDDRVSVALSGDEKELLEATARQQGFRDASHYLRAIALARSGPVNAGRENRGKPDRARVDRTQRE